MATIHIPLQKSDPEGHALMGELIRNLYLDAQCYEFALALSESLGWPIVGVIAPYNGELTVRHAVLLSSHNAYFDARGYLIKSEIGAPFGLDSSEYRLKLPLTRADLEQVRPIDEHAMRLARELAEAYWPKLPWKDGLVKRTTAFIDELETLSRKHGIWVFGHLPTTWPGLSVGEGEEVAGYTLETNSTGLSMRFNRRYSSEN